MNGVIKKSGNQNLPASAIQQVPVATSPLMVKVFFPVPAVTLINMSLGSLSVTLLLPFPAVTSPSVCRCHHQIKKCIVTFRTDGSVITAFIGECVITAVQSHNPLNFSTAVIQYVVVFTASSNAIAVPVVDAALILTFIGKGLCFEASTTA